MGYKICKFSTRNFIWLTTVFIDDELWIIITIFCVSCWRWLGLFFSVLSIFGLPLCAGQQTFSRGQDRLCSLWPLTPLTATEGAELIRQLIPPLLSVLNSQPPRLATCLSRSFSANLWHQVLKFNLLAHETVAENGTSAQTWKDSLACTGPQQFPANLFVLYCTHQVPVSHNPFPL